MKPVVWVPLEMSLFDLAYKIQTEEQFSQGNRLEGRSDGRSRQYG